MSNGRGCHLVKLLPRWQRTATQKIIQRQESREKTMAFGSEYDIDLKASGSGWMGTFSNLVRTAVTDIYEGVGPFDGEVTQFDGMVHTGKIEPYAGNDGYTAIIVNSFRIDTDDIVRLRA